MSLEQLGLDVVKLGVPSVYSVCVGVDSDTLNAGEPGRGAGSSPELWNDALVVMTSGLSRRKREARSTLQVAEGARRVTLLLNGTSRPHTLLPFSDLLVTFFLALKANDACLKVSASRSRHPVQLTCCLCAGWVSAALHHLQQHWALPDPHWGVGPLLQKKWVVVWSLATGPVYHQRHLINDVDKGQK